MVKKIRVYVEGGGDSFETRAQIRRGFSIFLNKLGSSIDVIACGPRDSAYHDFLNAWEDYPGAFLVLLVDSESKVTLDPLGHLAYHDRWVFEGIHREHCHLMVQIMEAWFLADIEALKTFYGQGFREDKIQHSLNIENISKNTIDVKLRAATRSSEKGKYHKIKHASKILELLNINKVRAVAPHCERLCSTLEMLAGANT